MIDRLQQLERQLQTANKRITDLEARYLALLEDLKAVRAEMARTMGPRGTTPPPEPGYQPAFDRWPGAER